MASHRHYPPKKAPRHHQPGPTAITSRMSDFHDKLVFNAYSIWLFTSSDIKTILFPTSFFALVNYRALASFGITWLREDAITPSVLTARVALATIWVWIHLLPLSINNQRSPSAILEDTINKPWRPMPSRRVSSQSARALVYSLYPMASLVALILGGIRQSLGLLFLGTWYNAWGGANSHPVIRNFLNGLGYICFTSGALEVARGEPLPLANPHLTKWLLALGGVILTTIHVQDMPDQEGDRLRHRRTIPLVIGDKWARLSIACSMTLWGILCPMIWNAGWMATIMCSGLAVIVAVRSLLYHSVRADYLTYWVYNVWICSIYALPLMATARNSEY